MTTYNITTNSGTPVTKSMCEYISSDSAINTINIVDSLEEKISEILKRFAPPEYTEVKCRECGGTIDQKWDDHIIKCPYCKTVYVIGRKMMNG